MASERHTNRKAQRETGPCGNRPQLNQMGPPKKDGVNKRRGLNFKVDPAKPVNPPPNPPKAQHQTPQTAGPKREETPPPKLKDPAADKFAQQLSAGRAGTDRRGGWPLVRVLGPNLGPLFPCGCMKETCIYIYICVHMYYALFSRKKEEGLEVGKQSVLFFLQYLERSQVMVSFGYYDTIA